MVNRLRGRGLVVGAIALAIVVTALLLWPRHTEPQVRPSTDEDCRARLVQLRKYVADYQRQHGRYPRELFDPSTTVGVPTYYRCPVSSRNYSYDPDRWPNRWVICTLPDHDEY